MTIATNMENQLRKNRNELVHRRSRRNHVRQVYNDALQRHAIPPNRPPVDPETLAVVRAEVREKLQQEKRRNIRIAFFALAAGLVLVTIVWLLLRLYLLYWWAP